MTAGTSDDHSEEEAGTVERDNGLEADAFVFLGEVEAGRSEELLDDLAAEGIAAYAVEGDPAESVYVDRSSVGYAEALLRRSGASVDESDADSGDDESADSDGDRGEDDDFDRIVAAFDRDDGDEQDRPWPDAEDLADGDGDDDKDEEEEEERTVGSNQARVSVIRLDTEEDEPKDTEDRYVRPEPPALPKGDVWTKGAWVLMLFALAYPIAGLLLDWEMPGWSIALAVVAFIAGIVIHVLRLRDPRDGSDSDDGAVV